MTDFIEALIFIALRLTFYAIIFDRCPDTWEGPNCDIDVNECEEFEHTDLGCKNGATCQNTPGGYL